MEYFAHDITLPWIRENGYREILEIGASMGDNSQQILTVPGVHLTMIDPGLDCDLAKKFSHQNNVTAIRDISLKGLTQCTAPFDCIFIDGDHNWYTVYQELKIINERKLLNSGGTIFFHDVCWPYDRRDMYYIPETIPAEFRQPFAKKGIARGQSSLLETGGFNAHLFNATKEGGPKNGVLTAVEDFIKDFGREDYTFLIDKRQHGLGILVRKKDGKTSSLTLRLRLKLKYIQLKNPLEDFLKSQCPLLAKTLIRIKNSFK